MNGSNDPNISVMHDLLKEVGRIGGKVDAIHDRQLEQTSWLDKMEGRLRATEAKAAKNALITSGVVAVFVAALTSFIRTKFNG